MAKASFKLELKADNTIEMRVTSDAMETRIQRFNFATEEEAVAGMRRAMEFALEISRDATGFISREREEKPAR